MPPYSFTALFQSFYCSARARRLDWRRRCLVLCFMRSRGCVDCHTYVRGLRCLLPLRLRLRALHLLLCGWVTVDRNAHHDTARAQAARDRQAHSSHDSKSNSTDPQSGSDL